MLPTNPLLNATAPAGPHLPVATLRQYAAGTLAPAARHRVEAHTLACPCCADILDGLLQTTPATTDAALAQLRQRLRRRVGQPAPAALPAARTRPRNRWLVPQLAAAALLFGLLAGGWWTWQQRHPAAPAVATAPVSAAANATPVRPAPAATPVTTLPMDAPLVTSAKQPANQHRHLRPARTDRVVVSIGTTCDDDVQYQPDKEEADEAELAAAIGAGKTADSTAKVPDSSSTTVPGGLALAINPLARAKSMTHSDTAATRLSGRAAGEAVAAPARSLANAALVRDRAMPAAPAVPPAPAGGYPAWREKIRREATEFQPEEGEPAVSGAVQLRVTIGADGKVQEIRVLHGLRADYDAEAQRLVCDGPGWVPGIGGGKRSTQAVDVTVPFQ